MTFTEWVLKHTKRNTPLGDLARDIRDDEEWPAQATTRNEFARYLRRVGACDGATETFSRAWASYLAARRKTNTTTGAGA